jgi:hypothetical protein
MGGVASRSHRPYSRLSSRSRASTGTRSFAARTGSGAVVRRPANGHRFGDAEVRRPSYNSSGSAHVVGGSQTSGMFMGSAPGEPGTFDGDRTVVGRMSKATPCGCGLVFRGSARGSDDLPVTRTRGNPADEDATDRSGSGMSSASRTGRGSPSGSLSRSATLTAGTAASIRLAASSGAARRRCPPPPS